jgi:hypothetical protein
MKLWGLQSGFSIFRYIPTRSFEKELNLREMLADNQAEMRRNPHRWK